MPDGCFPDGYLPDGYIPDWTFPRECFPRRSFFPDGHFPSRTFPRRTFTLTDISPNLDSPKSKIKFIYRLVINFAVSTIWRTNISCENICIFQYMAANSARHRTFYRKFVRHKQKKIRRLFSCPEIYLMSRERKIPSGKFARGRVP